jgi:hypothetical protein
MSYLPNKPTSHGVCLKTLADGHSRVMLAMEFVEGATEQSQKRYSNIGKAAAVTLRLTEPWHNQGPRVVIADSWFGGLPTSVALIEKRLHSVCNVKTHTKHFCKKELWADAKGSKGGWERNDRAYRLLELQVDGNKVQFAAAFHMDKAPMTLLGTAGSSNEAPIVTRRRVYMTQEGDLVHWVGKLEQPQIHAIYRTFFNAVDVHNKLALGPRSATAMCAKSLPLKIWLATLAMAATNAYLAYSKAAKLTSEDYSNSDFKTDLVQGLLECAGRSSVQAQAGAEPEGRLTRATLVATADKRMTMPPGLRGHGLSSHKDKRRKCTECGNMTKTICECGRAVCGVKQGVRCWAWHLEKVMTGAVDVEPIRAPRDKRARHTI